MAKTKTAPNSTPNSYQLAGDTIQVSYSTTGIDGKPHFSFTKGSKTLDFAGTQISSQTLKLGTLVSVTIAVVPDLSTTTFSILLPAIKLPASNRQAFRTIGITTVTRTTIAGPPVGVQQTYTIVALRGTARRVVF